MNGMKVKRLWLLLLLTPLLVGCETLSFYHQAAWGQWQIMRQRVALDTAIASPDTEPATRQQLELARRLLDFAEETLKLPTEERYTSFVGLSREYVVWNVFAAPPYELDGRQWCYPIVGCAPYRGYFKEARARTVAARIEERGLEVYVAGVPAYSTLGWFDDPLLSTFISWPEPDLANLLFHELAHAEVWVPGDTAFNESFASFVGDEGARQWFVEQDRLETWDAWQDRRAGWHAFRDFSLEAKNTLEAIYREVPQSELAAEKAAALASYQACYTEQREMLGGGRYDTLMAQSFNNAFLVSIGTYADWLPAFTALFGNVGSDWTRFFEAVSELAGMDGDARLQALEELSGEQGIGHEADDEGAEQVYCEPLSRHRLDAETAG